MTSEPLRIAHVVHAIAPAHGGPSVTVPMLCEGLSALGNEVHLHTTSFGGLAAPRPGGFELHAHPTLPLGGRLGLSPRMHRALRAEAQVAHIVHSHGLWLWTNLDAHLTTRKRRARVVISPRGMLEPYALGRSRLRKQLVWLLGQGAALRDAHCIHVTSEAEYDAVRALGLRAPVAVVPNGVALPPQHESAASDRRTALFLGRIHPKKGVELLLHAWQQVAADHPDWDLHIVGPCDSQYARDMQTLAAQLALPRVTFTGPAFGAAREQALARAELFVLPTHSENFGLAVAEALAAGVPVICSKGAPWAGLHREQCGEWIDQDLGALVAALRRAFASSRDELAARGARGRSWMKRDFGWPLQSRKMESVYRWLLGQQSAPSWVRAD